MTEERKDYNSNYSNILKNLCNILKEHSNKESSYATFIQTQAITINWGDYFPFNTTESYNEDIVLMNPSTIMVYKSGVYHIIYKIPVSIDDKKDKLEQSIGLYINNILQKNIQRTFGVMDPNYKKCMSIIGDVILYVPDNTVIRLKNDGFSNTNKSISTCLREDSLATFNIVKIG